MSATVTYKGQTITTAENQTRTLLTAGKYMEDDVTITDVTRADEDTLLLALRNQITSVEDDTLTSIRNMGLAYMTALTSVRFPELQTINQYAFYDDYNLVMDGWPFPKAKSCSSWSAPMWKWKSAAMPTGYRLPPPPRGWRTSPSTSRYRPMKPRKSAGNTGEFPTEK